MDEQTTAKATQLVNELPTNPSASDALFELWQTNKLVVSQVLRTLGLHNSNLEIKLASLKELDKWLVNVNYKMPFRKLTYSLIILTGDGNPEVAKLSHDLLYAFFSRANRQVRDDLYAMLQKMGKDMTLKNEIEGTNEPKEKTPEPIKIEQSVPRKINFEFLKDPQFKRQDIPPIKRMPYDLNEEISKQLKHFNGKETEDNWKARYLCFQYLRLIVRSGDFDSAYENFRKLSVGLNNAVLSLRSSVVIEAGQCIKDLAEMFSGGEFYTEMFQPLLPNLMATATSVKKVQATQAKLATCAIFYYSTTCSLKMFEFIQKESSNTKPVGRTLAYTCLHITLTKHYAELAFDHDIVEIICRALADASPEGRKEGKELYLTCVDLNPKMARKIESKVSGPTLRMLQRGNPAAPAPPRAASAPESVRRNMVEVKKPTARYVPSAGSSAPSLMLGPMPSSMNRIPSPISSSSEFLPTSSIQPTPAREPAPEPAQENVVADADVEINDAQADAPADAHPHAEAEAHPQPDAHPQSDAASPPPPPQLDDKLDEPILRSITPPSFALGEKSTVTLTQQPAPAFDPIPRLTQSIQDISMHDSSDDLAADEDGTSFMSADTSIESNAKRVSGDDIPLFPRSSVDCKDTISEMLQKVRNFTITAPELAALALLIVEDTDVTSTTALASARKTWSQHNTFDMDLKESILPFISEKADNETVCDTALVVLQCLLDRELPHSSSYLNPIDCLTALFKVSETIQGSNLIVLDHHLPTLTKRLVTHPELQSSDLMELLSNQFTPNAVSHTKTLVIALITHAILHRPLLPEHGDQVNDIVLHALSDNDVVVRADAYPALALVHKADKSVGESAIDQLTDAQRKLFSKFTESAT